MTAAAQLDPSGAFTLVIPAAPPAELPRGVKTVYKRAVANGFRVEVSFSHASIEKDVYEDLYDEDGSPLLTDKGKQRRRVVGQTATIMPSIALRLQHDEHQQGQAGWWVDGKVEGWAWPSDGSDIRRAIRASQLGTLVDLDELAAQSLDAARTLDAAAQQLCHCFDCKARPRHLEMT